MLFSPPSLAVALRHSTQLLALCIMYQLVINRSPNVLEFRFIIHGFAYKLRKLYTPEYSLAKQITVGPVYSDHAISRLMEVVEQSYGLRAHTTCW
ncbi:hypothetical protein BC629DRAFT_355005 [Irpex lacteus]|nr:hypothetical protein BC629DRAFT_355005 [Irpex lacteus]